MAFGESRDVADLFLFLYFQCSELGGVIWQVFGGGRNGGPILGLLNTPTLAALGWGTRRQEIVSGQ